MIHDPDHQPIPPEYREFLNDLAHELDERFNPTPPGVLPAHRKKKIGFFLAMFEFNAHGRFNYISNADKLDVKTMLKDIAARIEARERMDAAGPVKGGKQ